uniref:hypothetical protein n=1 Tax=Jatropha curcas TaxID=180498 RepID=UPI0027A322FF|nr:hypothetical protein QLP06_mgp024 [Jatropha curcas]WFG81215.1 hypothetical protein [Jatropha curcas]
MTRSIRSGANRGCLLSLVAKEKGGAFFVVIVGGSHEIYAGRMKVEGPFDSLRGIAAPSPGAIPEPSCRRAGRAGPEFRPDQTLLCLSCSHARRPEDLSCPGLNRQIYM